MGHDYLSSAGQDDSRKRDQIDGRPDASYRCDPAPVEEPGTDRRVLHPRRRRPRTGDEVEGNLGADAWQKHTTLGGALAPGESVA